MDVDERLIKKHVKYMYQSKKKRVKEKHKIALFELMNQEIKRAEEENLVKLK